MIDEDKLKRSEAYLLKANEDLLNCKGFGLFMVMKNGKLKYQGNGEEINQAEMYGLRAFIHNFDYMQLPVNQPPES